MAQTEFRVQNSEFRMKLAIVLLTVLLLVHPSSSFAESSYVFPYPSEMPGSKFYAINLIWEKISKYWHFGNFGQFKYSLKMADKYLIEAKTLFDYKQYLLGLEALKKSNYYFKYSLPSLKRAEKRGENILEKMSILKEASLKHIEYLGQMDLATPDIFVWEPEKSSPTTLLLKDTLMNAIDIRKDSL